MATGTSAAELRELSNADLEAKLRENKEELFNLRFQLATGQLDNNRRLGVVRKTLPASRAAQRELGLSPMPGGDE